MSKNLANFLVFASPAILLLVGGGIEYFVHDHVLGLEHFLGFLLLMGSSFFLYRVSEYEETN